MRICFLKIENFRGIKKAKIPIPSHCAFLGSNNCGKTAVASALALLLSRDRWIQNITEYDFNGGNPSPSTRFTIIATLTGFNSANNDPTEFPEWFNIERGGRVVWWKESEHKVSYEADPPQGTEMAIEIGISGRYNDEICEFELRRYFYDGITDPFTLDPFIQFPNKLLSEIGLFFIPNLRHWDSTLSFGSGQFLKLLHEIDSIPGDKINAYKTEMRDPTNKIEEADQFKDLVKAVEEELHSFTLLPEDSKIIYRSTQLSVNS